MCLFLCLQTSSAFCAGLSPLFCAGSPSVGSLPPLLRAGPSVTPPPPPSRVQVPPQWVLAPPSPVCRSSALCHPPLCAGFSTPPFCAGSPSAGSSFSLSLSLPLCAGTSLCAGLSTPPPLFFFCAGSPVEGSSPLLLCAGLFLSLPLCAGSPSVGSFPTPSL